MNTIEIMLLGPFALMKSGGEGDVLGGIIFLLVIMAAAFAVYKVKHILVRIMSVRLCVLWIFRALSVTHICVRFDGAELRASRNDEASRQILGGHHR